ncbi:HD domain-containing protein [Candidatus Pacebacteria bacterium]|nr:HD domain-containing protein [Candidatus Paceibacterota bacterium]
MITRQDIPQEVQEVAETLEKAGYDAYLVGGCVRDLLIGKTPKDWDLTTNAHPEQIEALWGEEETFCNNDYGTVGVVNEDTENESLKVVEVTPYRSEGTYSDARRPDNVEFGVSLEEDLKRRDFTVNAIAYRLKDEKVVDLFDGTSDITKKRLKTVGDPDERFTEDALRMMRAVRLACQLNFSIEAQSMAAITRHRKQLSRISVERIAQEFSKILASPAPMQGIVFLDRLELLEYVLPEILPSKGCEQGGIHAYDVYEHLLRTCQAAADKDFTLEMRYAALLHDIGKPATRRTGGKNKHYTFFGHEVVGAKMTKKIMERLKLPRELTQNVVNLVRWHMFFSDPDEITLAAVRRTITRVGEEHIDNLLNLRVCDRIGTGRPKEQPFRFRKYKAMVDEALRDPISVKLLQIDGDIIMEKTGEKPGKRLGYVLHALLEEVLEDPSKNDAKWLETRTFELLKLPEEELKALADAGKEKQSAEEAAALAEIAREHKVG